MGSEQEQPTGQRHEQPTEARFFTLGNALREVANTLLDAGFDEAEATLQFRRTLLTVAIERTGSECSAAKYVGLHRNTISRILRRGAKKKAREQAAKAGVPRRGVHGKKPVQRYVGGVGEARRAA